MTDEPKKPVDLAGYRQERKGPQDVVSPYPQEYIELRADVDAAVGALVEYYDSHPITPEDRDLEAEERIRAEVLSILGKTLNFNVVLVVNGILRGLI
jgi:hypothetical protein